MDMRVIRRRENWVNRVRGTYDTGHIVSLGVHNKRNDKSVKTQHFSENENQNLSYPSISIRIRLHTCVYIDIPCRRKVWAVEQFLGHRRHRRYRLRNLQRDLQDQLRDLHQGR